MSAVIPSAAAVDTLLPLLLAAVERRHGGDWMGALACLDEVLRVDPHFLPAQIERAPVLAHLGRYEEALAALDEFLRLVPAPEISAIYDDIRQMAFAAFAAAIGTVEEVAARLRRAALYCQVGEPAQALADYEAALARSPDAVDALNGCGTALLALNRHDEALTAYRRACELAPLRAEFHYNQGNVLQQQGRLAEARIAYQRAIALVPDFAEAQLEIAHCWLGEGDARGWGGLEWRWQTAQLKRHWLACGRPLWLGKAGVDVLPPNAGEPLGTVDLAGKTLLVWAEQGFGDVIQFARFVPRLAQSTSAARVILRVPAPLQRLLAELAVNAPTLHVVGDDGDLPPHDAHVPLLSLPLALGLDAPASEKGAPYLRADPIEVAHWRARLGPAAGRRVGLVWAGRQYGVLNRTRDLSLCELRPLVAAEENLGVELISLQRDVPAADQETLAQWPSLRQLSGAFPDFAATAAVLEAVDLVICVDTAVAHLAGALGIPCWLLLRYGSEWRWQYGRSDSPWYRSLRIFRQTRAGDWGTVIAEVCAALAGVPERQSVAA
ncbi:tetratricopeptide repeat protein [Rhodocyclus tenuis]|uniref:Tetratricopeptide repeat protein n=1 Tax=Rhodocyclus gracilis TaxID=2929842 RepID=A0ABX0WGH9_9RHOO|nr:tetratricopeptide repeat protein [Rhodocyclus gracilis]NJA88825.1 tetratricopeptide repeat protein [Rhodocyclus gracilis]